MQRRRSLLNILYQRTCEVVFKGCCAHSEKVTIEVLISKDRAVDDIDV